MRYFAPSQLSENISETPEGFLVCIGVSIARTGEMTYGPGETPLEVGEDGRVRVSRDSKEVFRPETIASFEGKPITLGHPQDFVSPENWKHLTKGIVQNVRRGEGETENDLIADILITDASAILMVKNGLRELSCGYEAEYTQTGAGIGTQSNIVGNHVALVDNGRAGSSYAINDQKWKGTPMAKLAEKIKSIFGKAQDELTALAKDAEGEMEKGKKDDKASDAGAYDELVKMVKDLGEKVGAMGKPANKDASTEPTESEPAKVDAKDDEESSGLEARLAKLEAAVSKLLEGQASGDADEDDEGEEVEASEDDGEEMESSLTGDEASRVEILAPGMKVTKDSKDFKKKALLEAYKTADGKKAIHVLTGGKAPTFDSAEKTDAHFVAVSELLKSARSSDLARSRTRDASGDGTSETTGAKTAEDMNAINAKFYAQK